MWGRPRRCPVPRLLTLRPLSVAEEATIERLARSRIAPARTVERARIVWLAHHGRRVPAAAREVGVSEQTWFGERPDPAFAEKRGLSSPSTKRRPGAAS